MRRGGRRALLLRTGPRIGLSGDRIGALERTIRRWGGAALVAGRFVGPVRALAPFLAGSSAIPLRRLAAYSVVGAGAWCSALIVAGYAFAASLENHLDVAGNVALGLAGALVLTCALRARGNAAGAPVPA